MDGDSIKALRARVEQLEAELALKSGGSAVLAFQNAPVALWLDDFSPLMRWLGELAESGVRNPGVYFRQNPGELAHAAKLITILDVNQAALDMMGVVSTQELLGGYERLFTIFSRRPFLELLLDLWEGRQEIHLEGQGVNLAGKKLDYTLDLRVPLQNGAPDYTRVVVSVQDVTVRKQAEVVFRESHDQFHGIVNNLALGVALINERHEVLFANPQMRKWFPRMGLKNRPLCYACLVEPSLEACPGCPVMEALRCGTPCKGELSVRTSLGTIPVAITASPFVNSKGERVVVELVEDISGRRRMEEVLERNSKSLQDAFAWRQAIYDHSGVGILVVDEGRRITECNARSLAILGYSEGELEGRHVGLLHVSARACEAFARRYFQKIAHKDVVTVEYKVRRNDGRRIWCLFSGCMVPQGDGTRVIWVLQDITARKQMERELIKARKAAEAATKAKSQFLANMSHELRTPLNAILGITELTLGTQLTDEQRSHLELIDESSRHLLSTLGDILDFSQIEADRLEIVPIAFDLHNAVGGLYRLLHGVASQKGLELRLEMEEGLPRMVIGDLGRLRQVLINLLGNALKFTRKGRVTLCGLRGERPGDVLFIVEDTGLGIPPQKRSMIFDVFTQADGSYARRHQGTGLGLALSRRLVELMGGDIWLETEQGQGSRFYVLLPFATPLPEQPSEADALTPCKLPPLRVLLAEDNTINQIVARKLLEKHGHDVHSVENGQLALESLARQDFDIVLMDIQMPVMDGLTAVRALRGGRDGVRDPSVPVVALTAHVFREDREAFLHAGVDCHVSKPFEVERLFAAMSQALALRGRDAAGAA